MNRIQSLDTTQGLINQLVGGVRLQIKTPSDGIELETISKQQSELIERTIKRQLQLDSQEIETNHKPNNSEQELISEDNSNNKVILKCLINC